MKKISTLMLNEKYQGILVLATISLLVAIITFTVTL
jgi:hypothetical protein